MRLLYVPTNYFYIKHIVWIKVNPNYEILFRLMGRLDPGVERRYWIREQRTKGNIDDIQEDLGKIET